MSGSTKMMGLFLASFNKNRIIICLLKCCKFIYVIFALQSHIRQNVFSSQQFLINFQMFALFSLIENCSFHTICGATSLILLQNNAAFGQKETKIDFDTLEFL